MLRWKEYFEKILNAKIMDTVKQIKEENEMHSTDNNETKKQDEITTINRSNKDAKK